jgi:hypothetical protein
VFEKALKAFSNLLKTADMSAEKHKGVFDAHPAAEEIFVGTDKNGSEQPFLARAHALNFAGGDPDKVKTIKRPLDKAAAKKAAEEAEAAAKKAAEEAEAAAKKAAEEEEKAAKEAAKKGQ